MQIRCYRCGTSFAIKQEEAAFALEALEETGGTHYDSNCPRCRHSNRISLEQLRKGAPRSSGEPKLTNAKEAQGDRPASDTVESPTAAEDREAKANLGETEQEEDGGSPVAANQKADADSGKLEPAE